MLGLMVQEVDEEEFSEVPDWKGEEGVQPDIGTHLASCQRTELIDLLEEFSDVLHGKPGQTHVMEHSIKTPGTEPIRLPPYRIPYAYREGVLKELQEMEENGVIEPSHSEWAFPIVVALKKDKSIRLCVDYRKLNAATPMDAYPIPRVDELLDKLGGSKFISTLDLARGYWQVPVAEEDRLYNAQWSVPVQGNAFWT